MRKFMGFVVYNALLILAAVIFLSIDKNNLIIYLGVTMADVVQIGVWVVIALALVAGNALLAYRMVKIQKAAQIADIPIAKFSGRESLSPEEIRSELSKFKALGPGLTHYIDTVHAQMDSMDRKQEKLRHILERNQIETLASVEAAIGQAEQGICRNIVKIMNRIILWDPEEWNRAGKETIYAQHRAYIERHIDANEEILTKCDILLSETVDYVNEKDSDHKSGQFHLDVMTETMQALKTMNRVEG